MLLVYIQFLGYISAFCVHCIKFVSPRLFYTEIFSFFFLSYSCYAFLVYNFANFDFIDTPMETIAIINNCIKYANVLHMPCMKKRQFFSQCLFRVIITNIIYSVVKKLFYRFFFCSLLHIKLFHRKTKLLIWYALNYY